MKLKKVHITEFQSVRDSNPFEIDDVTCLVGKNEAGKTAILQALYRLNPIVEKDGKYSVTDDYPRVDVEDYQQAVEDKERHPARVITATFTLDDELEDIESDFGAKAIIKPEFTLSKGYTNRPTFSLLVNNKEALKHLISEAQLLPEVATALSKTNKLDEAIGLLTAQEQTSEVARLLKLLNDIKPRDFNGYIYDHYIDPNLPKFLYFDEYYQMRGHENIEALITRKANGTLENSDHPMIGLIELARLQLEDLLNPERTQDLVNKIEGAGNHLSKKVLNYWSQNRHLDMRFDVRPARPGDPEGMTSGTNIWASVYDMRHRVTTSLGKRSRGFVWFFSFLAWYSQIKKENKSVILLLDEPAMALHAKAQEDLLRYIETEIKGVHQIIYSTHSPFMVDPRHFERVRIVQDKGIDSTSPIKPEEDGTKVLTEVFEASGDSLFPLQGALGYEIYQTLFIGPNSLIVEGVSDLVYLQVISALLESKNRIGLSSKWTITPVGGSDKVPTFVALIGSQKNLNIATLIDFQIKDQQSIENLYKRKLLEKNRVLTFADFTGTTEADIEDMFDEDFYLKIFNGEFKSSLQKAIKTSTLKSKSPRMTVRLETHFKDNPMKNNMPYNHYRPARYLAENISTLGKEIPDATLDRFEAAFTKLNKLVAE